MKKTKMICYLGVFTALYVALSMTVKIPLISHIQTDLGYIVFGAACVLFGRKAFIVGALGCMLESLIINGMFPLGWILGQCFIGVACGTVFMLCDNHSKKHLQNYLICVIAIVLSIFIGITGIKTAVECALYNIPIEVKIVKNAIAASADAIPMIMGYMIGKSIKVNFNGEEQK